MLPIAALLDRGRTDNSEDMLRYESVIVGLDGFSEGCGDASFVRKSMVNVRFERSNFSWSMMDSIFRKVDFVDCFFDRVWMTRTEWTDCRFDGSTMTPDLTDAVFEDCSFRGVRLKGVAQEYGGRRTRFIGCDFSNAKFVGIKLLAARFLDCQMEGAQFVRCDLRGTIINGERS